jgi:hypothetical protein
MLDAEAGHFKIGDLHYKLACPNAWLSRHSPVADELEDAPRSERDSLVPGNFNEAIQEFINDNLSTSMFFGLLPQNPCIHIVVTNAPNCDRKKIIITPAAAEEQEALDNITPVSVQKNPCPSPKGEEKPAHRCNSGVCPGCASGYGCYAVQKAPSKASGKYSVSGKDIEEPRTRAYCLKKTRVKDGEYNKINESIHEAKKIRIKMKRGTK